MKTPYSQPIAPSQSAPKGLGIYSSQEYESSIIPWTLISVGAHLTIFFLIWLVWVALHFFGWIPKFDNLAMKQRDVEFVLVDNTPTQKPRKPTNKRAEHASRSGGTKIANKPVALAQQAAGARSKASKASNQPAAKPQQARPSRQAQPSQQPKMAQAPRPQPQHQQQQQQPTPTPKQAPPAPKAPRPVKVANANPALPPKPIAPHIKLPAPPNPTLANGGPVARTASSNSGTSGSAGASGSPGATMIAGAPGRSGGSGFSSGRPGSSGGGGNGSYSQSGSPGGGGGRPGIDAEAEPDFGPYIAELQRRIRRNWAPPTEDRSKRIIAVFQISRDGRLLSLNIQQSSGSPPADAAAMAAVRQSAPFRPLPPNYKGKSIPVQFTFDYEISGHGSASMR